MLESGTILKVDGPIKTMTQAYFDEFFSHSHTNFVSISKNLECDANEQLQCNANGMMITHRINILGSRLLRDIANSSRSLLDMSNALSNILPFPARFPFIDFTFR